MIAAAVGTVAAVTTLTTLSVGPVLQRLPRAEDAPDYARLATPAFRIEVGIVVAIAMSVVVWTTPVSHWLAWTGLTVAGALAVSIDARTTWLPRALTRVGWAVSGIGVVVASVAEAGPMTLLVSLLGALVIGGFFHAVWRVSGQLGYGDVRLMAMVGGVTALEGAEVAAGAVLLGTLVGALWAVIHRLRTGTNGPFPYGPALFSGPYLALVVQPLTT